MAQRPKKQPSAEARNDYGVTPEQFVTVWNTSGSLEEAASRLKMPAPVAAARASKYRSVGVNLKKMPRKPRADGLDVEKLNRLIETLPAAPPDRTARMEYRLAAQLAAP